MNGEGRTAVKIYKHKALVGKFKTMYVEGLLALKCFRDSEINLDCKSLKNVEKQRGPSQVQRAGWGNENH